MITGHIKSHGDSGAGCFEERGDNLCHAHVWNPVTLTYVPVQEPILVPQAAKDMDFADGDGGRGREVESEEAKIAWALPPSQ